MDAEERGYAPPLARGQAVKLSPTLRVLFAGS